VLGKPKSADKIGEAAGKLGIHGNKMDYVPDMGLVLYNTGIVEPGNSETIWFEVPPFEGNYDFVCTMPGHYMIMRGVLKVKK
jgi:azurin